MSKIKNIVARQILDSRGNPTVETDVILTSGAFGRAAVGSGVSIGIKEAQELRDGNRDAYLGKGVLKAIFNINTEIKRALIGLDAVDQRLIDQTMIQLDGTKNKARLGANAILSVSLACAKASASDLKKPLYRYLMDSQDYIMPVPMMNLINGGQHSDNTIDIQEFMIMPVGFSCFSDALRCGTEIFHLLKKIILNEGYQFSGIGDEGGYTPFFPSNEVAIEMILKAVEKSGYRVGEEVYIALDLASSTFYDYDNKKYLLQSENKSLSSAELVEYLSSWVNKYPIISIEDGMAENDWDGWRLLTESLGKKVQLVGDDVFVTNSKILYQGIKKGVANSILIKLNQIGTLTETLETMATAAQAGYTSIVSHRSGETSDTTISDFAVATGAGQIKAGSLSRSDRVEKYNQLLRIEEELKNSSIYPGIKTFNFSANMPSNKALENRKRSTKNNIKNDNHRQITK